MVGDGDIDGEGLAEQLCDGLAAPRPSGLLDGLCPVDRPEVLLEDDGPWLPNPLGTPGCAPPRWWWPPLVELLDPLSAGLMSASRTFPRAKTPATTMTTAPPTATAGRSHVMVDPVHLRSLASSTLLRRRAAV
jgi:hypothetical protein